MGEAVHPDFFMSPDGSNRESLRQQGYRFVDLIIDDILSRTTGDFGQPRPPAIAPFEIPEHGRPMVDLMAELRRTVIPHSLNLHHRGYMGHMDSVPLAITIWADALIAALNNNMLSYELAPFFTDLEQQLIHWFSQLFGLGDSAGGTLTAGGSLANLTALLAARNHTQTEASRRGVTMPQMALVSEAAHTSFDKAMNVLGLGQDHLIRIPTNPRGELQIDALHQTLDTLAGRGCIPFVIVAIAGTTVTGAIDPLAEIGAIARERGIWFHVDAAYGGAAIFSESRRSHLRGIELADSITFNPQKWLWVARTCAMVLVRHAPTLGRALDTPLPYMDEAQTNYGSLTLQGTRRTDSLKLWLALQALGQSGCRQLVEDSLMATELFCQWVQRQPQIDLICEPTLNIACLRSTDPAVSNAMLQKQWIAAGRRWLSLPLWRGDRILKAVVLHPHQQWHQP
ncbi:MAG: aspartate aminotransferase family protein [Oscillatoriales cyanobacterium SM2_2_1]|nr:aspartate aminotransferase family protein [Oscillatoriales cyanobacterium SM2_2_1]